jgi:hypothetical protein
MVFSTRKSVGSCRAHTAANECSAENILFPGLDDVSSVLPNLHC